MHQTSLSMKGSKHISASKACAKNSGDFVVASDVAPAIRLKAITSAERKKLRIPSYRYILP
jgi:hypothetical protein